MNAEDDLPRSMVVIVLVVVVWALAVWAGGHLADGRHASVSADLKEA